MKHALRAASVLAIALTISACKQDAAEPAATTAAASARSGIDGTWVADVGTAQISGKPDEVLLMNGQYDCVTCTPPYKVPADGTFHPVTGHSYADEIAVKIDSDSKVTETTRKGGKVVGTTTYTVSPDGNTTAIAYTSTTVEGGKPTSGTSTQTREGPAPAGAHAISGKWGATKVANVSPEALTVTYRLDGDTLNMTSPDGASFSAKLGGPEAPVTGDIGKTMVLATGTGDNAYRLVSRRDGKEIGATDITIDGDVMRAKWTDSRTGSTTSYEAKRQ